MASLSPAVGKAITTSAANTHSLAAGCFIVGLFAKQFYLFPSGSFQIGDFFLFLSFLLVVAKEGYEFKIDRIDLPLLILVALVIAVNTIWYGVMGTDDYLRYTLFYVFNFSIIYAFRRVCTTEKALLGMLWVLRIALLFQLLVCLIGAGRNYGSARYMGTFNDPNQFGFFIFASLLFIQIASEKLGKRTYVAYDLVALYMIIESGSTGMLLGVFVLFVIKLVRFGQRNAHRRLVASILIAFVVFWSCVVIDPQAREIKYPEIGNPSIDFIGERVVAKINKVLSPEEGEYSNSIIVDRGLTKAVMYPEYFLLGAGEGSKDRFVGANTNEIHSTPISICFYYGIVAFGAFVLWIARNILQANNLRNSFLVGLPMVVECLFLLNQRQPLFWLVFALLSQRVETGDRVSKVGVAAVPDGRPTAQ